MSPVGWDSVNLSVEYKLIYHQTGDPVMKNLILTALLCATAVCHAARQPNVIYILADDLGYGDIGVYGQSHFETPNLDRLAEQGMRFTQHYSENTVCAPSRLRRSR